MQATQQKMPINFAASFQKAASKFNELSETKKEDLKRKAFLDELLKDIQTEHQT